MKAFIKSGWRTFCEAERQRWQLLGGLLGGWPMLAMAAMAMIVGWILFVDVLLRPLREYRDINRSAMTDVSAVAISAAFLGLILAIIIVLRLRRQHGLLRLSPNVGPLIFALNSRLGLAALLSLPPAVALRALTAVKAPYSLDGVISLADVPIQSFLSAGLMLVYLAALIVITFGWLRAPLRFASVPIYWGAMQWSTAKWQWLPLVACLVIVIGHRLWMRTEMASTVRVHRAAPRPQPNVLERLNTRRLRRAARAMGDHRSSKRVTALLATRSNVLFTSLAVLFTAAYLGLMPRFMDASSSSWWFAYMVAMLLALPTPIPMGPVMLLPLGAQRHNVGAILMNVWVRDVWFRLALGVLLGLIVRTICWRFQVFSFSWPPYTETGDDLSVLLLWTPLMKAAGLCGVAYAICWTLSASPRFVRSAGSMGVLPMLLVIGFALLGAASNWLLERVVLALSGGDMAVVRFAIVSGALFPALAWSVNRHLRTHWFDANLGEISTVMQAWTAQRQKSVMLS